MRLLKLSRPKTQIAEAAYLLYRAHNEGGVSRAGAMSDCFILNFPACVHVLRRRGVAISCDTIKRENKFGRVITYGVYRLDNPKDFPALYEMKVNV